MLPESRPYNTKPISQTSLYPHSTSSAYITTGGTPPVMAETLVVNNKSNI